MPINILSNAFGSWLPTLVADSYRVSSRTDPSDAEIGAHRGLVAARMLKVENIEIFMSYIAPGAQFRCTSDRVSQQGTDGRSISAREKLIQLLKIVNLPSALPTETFQLFRLAQPFTSANDILSRGVWMWQVCRVSKGHPLAAGTLSLPDVDDHEEMNVATGSRSSLFSRGR
ncbi:hypothetical protein [Aurantimonas sp. VKM B-3413]|uniref:hypothetical protein n=1 Tax=Aurantimonas sp. VKM B-3413 TaxID=2779401 RepID=UPI001E4D74C4|nr:hypothetical protein [Aurantimonas sp. VKM B-3413]MCB8837000.1 hypothetical protein [Aurantimonas sp. VKM B-3413]